MRRNTFRNPTRPQIPNPIPELPAHSAVDSDKHARTHEDRKLNAENGLIWMPRAKVEAAVFWQRLCCSGARADAKHLWQWPDICATRWIQDMVLLRGVHESVASQFPSGKQSGPISFMGTLCHERASISSCMMGFQQINLEEWAQPLGALSFQKADLESIGQCSGI